MAQSWRTLGGVALGAMVAGWLVVRLLHSSPESAIVDRPREEAADLPSLAAASPQKTARDTEAAAPTEPQPGDVAAPRSTRERDLIALENALLQDHRVSDLLFSYPGISEMPRILPYRRATEFWQPAFANAARSRR